MTFDINYRGKLKYEKKLFDADSKHFKTENDIKEKNSKLGNKYLNKGKYPYSDSQYDPNELSLTDQFFDDLDDLDLDDITVANGFPDPVTPRMMQQLYDYFDKLKKDLDDFTKLMDTLGSGMTIPVDPYKYPAVAQAISRMNPKAIGKAVDGHGYLVEADDPSALKSDKKVEFNNAIIDWPTYVRCLNLLSQLDKSNSDEAIKALEDDDDIDPDIISRGRNTKADDPDEPNDGSDEEKNAERSCQTNKMRMLILLFVQMLILDLPFRIGTIVSIASITITVFTVVIPIGLILAGVLLTILIMLLLMGRKCRKELPKDKKSWAKIGKQSLGMLKSVLSHSQGDPSQGLDEQAAEKMASDISNQSSLDTMNQVNSLKSFMSDTFGFSDDNDPSRYKGKGVPEQTRDPGDSNIIVEHVEKEVNNEKRDGQELGWSPAAVEFKRDAFNFEQTINNSLSGIQDLASNDIQVPLRHFNMLTNTAKLVGTNPLAAMRAIARDDFLRNLACCLIMGLITLATNNKIGDDVSDFKTKDQGLLKVIGFIKLFKSLVGMMIVQHSFKRVSNLTLIGEITNPLVDKLTKYVLRKLEIAKQNVMETVLNKIESLYDVEKGVMGSNKNSILNKCLPIKTFLKKFLLPYIDEIFRKLDEIYLALAKLLKIETNSFDEIKINMLKDIQWLRSLYSALNSLTIIFNKGVACKDLSEMSDQEVADILAKAGITPSIDDYLNFLSNQDLGDLINSILEKHGITEYDLSDIIEEGIKELGDMTKEEFDKLMKKLLEKIFEKQKDKYDLSDITEKVNQSISELGDSIKYSPKMIRGCREKILSDPNAPGSVTKFIEDFHS